MDPNMTRGLVAGIAILVGIGIVLGVVAGALIW